MRDKSCCFTGHRKIPYKDMDILPIRIRSAIIKLINEGYLNFNAGGALGFDTLAAKTVLDLKSEYKDIKLSLYLPHFTQADSWSERDRWLYEHIKSNADGVFYASQDYVRGCMHMRNRMLVDNSSVCICYLTQDKGGTAYTVDYAKRNNLRVINLTYEEGSALV